MNSCSRCGLSFEPFSEQVLKKHSPAIAGSSFLLSQPAECADCRLQRRYAYRNDQNFYYGSCAFCKKPLVTIYSPDKQIPILCDGCFWSDRFDPLSYGKELDLAQPIFQQIAALRGTVPRLGIYNTRSQNSEYTVHSSRNKNCYFGSSLVDCEDVLYGDLVNVSTRSADLLSCFKVELCYQCLYAYDCYNCDFCEVCVNLSDSAWCFDCRGGGELLGCCGVRNRHRMILNQTATKEEITATRKRLFSDPKFREKFAAQALELQLQTPKRPMWNTNVENSSGNYLLNSKGLKNCFDVREGEDCILTCESFVVTDVVDSSRIARSELLYCCNGNVDLRYSAFSNLCYQSDNLLYCDNCQTSSNCFGSFTLKKNSYCILNRQYSPADYLQLLTRIIDRMRETGEWGNFFPVNESVFGYNETKAADWFPLDPVTVNRNGWKLSSYEVLPKSGIKLYTPDELPATIEDVDDQILKGAIICADTKKPFRIAAAELEFYRKKGLPLPTRSPRQRHRLRVLRQLPRRLYNRSCEHCKAAIVSGYDTKRPEKVYCDQCYEQHLYG